MRRSGQSHRSGRFSRDSVLESVGPNGKMRGSAQQLTDRYMSLGKDALSQRDLIEAETFFQYAEHYRRLNAGLRGPKPQVRNQHGGDQGMAYQEKEEHASFEASPREEGQASDTLPSFVTGDADVSDKGDQEKADGSPAVKMGPPVKRVVKKTFKKKQEID